MKARSRTKEKERQTEQIFVCSSEALRAEVGLNLQQDCLMMMLLSNSTQIRCQRLLLLLLAAAAAAAADVVCRWGLNEWTAAEERGWGC